MTQIFVSYKSEDRERLRPLVQALEAEGFSVWWDAQIEAGEAWRDAIERQLESALCVVVAWSERSVGPEGRFVRDEAGRALSRGAYVPVLLDNVRLPIGFGEVQALSLIGWKGDRTDSRFRGVLSSVRAHVQSAEATQASAAHSANPHAGSQHAGSQHVGSQHVGSQHATGLHAALPSDSGHPVNRRGLIGGAIAAVVAVGTGSWWFLRPRPPSEGPDDKSIAVLPFANLSDDPGQNYFADGMAEELRGALTRIGQIKVIARTSSEQVRNTPATKAARELGVARILTGSVRRSSSLIRVSAQLVDGNSGVELWAETYDRPLGDVLQIQAGIATSVVEALRVRLAPEQKVALATVDTSSVAAHDLFLQATASLRSSSSSETSMREAVRLLDQAIAIDPNYVAALSVRAQTRVTLANAYESGEELRTAISESLATARRAVSLNANSAIAQSALGNVMANGLDIPGSIQHNQLAYQLGPGDPNVVSAYCTSLLNFRRYQEIFGIINQAIARDPLDPRPYGILGRSQFGLGRQAEAIETVKHALSLRAKYDSALSLLGDIYALQGRPQDAVPVYQLVSNGWDRFRGLTIARAKMGDRAGSDRELAELKKLDDGSINYQLAQVYVVRGESDLAVTHLESGYAALDGGLTYLYADPYMEPLRDQPRVQALLQKLGFPV